MSQLLNKLSSKIAAIETSIAVLETQLSACFNFGAKVSAGAAQFVSSSRLSAELEKKISSLRSEKQKFQEEKTKLEEVIAVAKTNTESALNVEIIFKRAKQLANRSAFSKKAPVKAEVKADTPKATKKATAKVDAPKASAKAPVNPLISSFKEEISRKTTAKALLKVTVPATGLNKTEQKLVRELLDAAIAKVETKIEVNVEAPKVEAANAAKVATKEKFAKATKVSKAKKKAAAKDLETKAKKAAKESIDKLNGAHGPKGAPTKGSFCEGAARAWEQLFKEEKEQQITPLEQPQTQIKQQPKKQPQPQTPRGVKCHKAKKERRRLAKGKAGYNSYILSLMREMDTVRGVEYPIVSLDLNKVTLPYRIALGKCKKTMPLSKFKKAFYFLSHEQGNKLSEMITFDGVLDINIYDDGTKSGSSAGTGNGNLKPSPKKGQKSMGKQQDKLEVLKELFLEAASFSRGLTNDFKNKVVAELPHLTNAGKKEIRQGIQKAIDEIELFLSLKANESAVEGLKDIKSDKIAYKAEKSLITQERQLGYTLIPQVVFRRNDSASSFMSGYDDIAGTEAAKATGFTVSFETTGEYNSAGNMIAEFCGVKTSLGDIIKVVAPDNASSEEKAKMTTIMGSTGYYPIVDGTFAKEGSDIFGFFNGLIHSTFKESDPEKAMVAALSYARSFVTASALKSFQVPVIVINEEDGFLKDNFILEGNDGAMVHGENLGSKLAFQMRALLSGGNIKDELLKPSEKTLAKGLSSYAKIVWCIEDKKVMLLEDLSACENVTVGGTKGFSFDAEYCNKEQVLKINNANKTFLVGLFINASVLKGAGKKQVLKYGNVIRPEKMLGWIIAEDNPFSAKTQWSWQQWLNSTPWDIDPKDPMFSLVSDNFINKLKDTVKSEFDLLKGLNSSKIEFWNKNSAVKSVTKYIQMSNIGADVAFAKFDLYKDQKGMKYAERNFFTAEFGTVRTPIQNSGDYHFGQAYSITKVITLVQKVKSLIEGAKDISDIRKAAIDALVNEFSKKHCPTQGSEVVEEFIDKFNGFEKLHEHLYSQTKSLDDLKREIQDTWLALKGFIAPAVANGVFWIHHEDQQKVNGDNDGDRNEIVFDKDRLAMMKKQHFKKDNSSIVDALVNVPPLKVKEERTEKVKSEVDKTQVANHNTTSSSFSFDLILKSPSTLNGQEEEDYKAYCRFITAAGNSPNQGNVGGITMIPPALEAFVRYYSKDKSSADNGYYYTSSKAKLVAKQNAYNAGQTLIDWQKRLLHLPSLLYWHKNKASNGKLNADLDYVICGKTKTHSYITDQEAAKFAANSLSQKELNAMLRSRVKKESWVESVPSMKDEGETVTITDPTQGYNTPGIYVYTAWLVNCLNIAECLIGDFDTKDNQPYSQMVYQIWEEWLESDFAGLNQVICQPIEIEEGMNSEDVLEIKRENIRKEIEKRYQDKIVKMSDGTPLGCGFDDFQWVFPNQLTKWMTDPVLGGSTPCPPQFDSLRKTLKESFYLFIAGSEFKEWWHEDKNKANRGFVKTKKLANKIVEDNAKILSDINSQHSKVVPSLNENTAENDWSTFILTLKSSFKGAVKQKLDSTSTSMRYSTDLKQSGADSLSMLYQAIGSWNSETGTGVLMNNLKKVLVNGREVLTEDRKTILNWFILNLKNIFCHNVIELESLKEAKDQDKVSEKRELLEEMNEFISENFLEALEEALENADRYHLAMGHVSDKVVALVKSLTSKSTRDDLQNFLSDIRKAQESAAIDLKKQLIDAALEGKDLTVPDDVTNKDAWLTEKKETIWFSSAEQRSVQAALTVFRNAYRVTEYLIGSNMSEKDIVKKIGDALIENIQVKDSSSPIQIMRTNVKIEVPEDLEIDVIYGLMMARNNITWLTKNIVDLRDNNLMFDLSKFLILKNSYTFMSAETLTVLNKLNGKLFNRENIKSYLCFTKRFGGGMVYTRAGKYILDLLLTNDKTKGQLGFTEEQLNAIRNIRSEIHGLTLAVIGNKVENDSEFGVCWTPDYLSNDRLSFYKKSDETRGLWSLKRELRKFLHNSLDKPLYVAPEGGEVDLGAFWPADVQNLMKSIGLPVIGGAPNYKKNKNKGTERLSAENINNIFDGIGTQSEKKEKPLSAGDKAASVSFLNHSTELLDSYSDDNSLASIAEKVIDHLQKEVNIVYLLSFFGVRSRMAEWLTAGIFAEEGSLERNLLRGAIKRTNVYAARQALGFLLEPLDQEGGLKRDSIKFRYSLSAEKAKAILNLACEKN